MAKISTGTTHDNSSATIKIVTSGRSSSVITIGDAHDNSQVSIDIKDIPDINENDKKSNFIISVNGNVENSTLIAGGGNRID